MTHPNDAPDIYSRPIEHHGGAKYIRTIREVNGGPGTLKVDVYCVIDAFGVTDAPLQHALKKILCCGLRGKGNKLDDIKGILDAMWRAYDIEKQRQAALDTDCPAEELQRTVREID